MWPELFTIPFIDFPLRAFGLLVATGFIVGVAVGSKLASKYGADPKNDPEKFADVSWWVLIGVILGARLAFVLVNFDHYAKSPENILKIWEGGLVMYGGLIGAIVLGLVKANLVKMPKLQTLDYGLTAGFLGQAIGRLGCLAVGDDFGSPTNMPWAITFPDPLPQGSAFPIELSTVPVHPTQLYMSAKALSLFFLGRWLLKNKKFHGQVTAILLMAYAVLRYIIEFFRFDMVARGGIYKEGHHPSDIQTNWQQLKIANEHGQITDVEKYRELLMSGAENMAPQLLMSTSQMVGIVMFILGGIMLLVFRRMNSLRISQ
ncbi:MAG: prolipoprotein diacylglyceryl transferase [Planctomycetota bacterium]|nr:prolipoprotein diacylglyceryl transferase [Planctomycetota bacterium]